jgi:hypothetical protein
VFSNFYVSLLFPLIRDLELGALNSFINKSGLESALVVSATANRLIHTNYVINIVCFSLFFIFLIALI